MDKRAILDPSGCAWVPSGRIPKRYQLRRWHSLVRVEVGAHTANRVMSMLKGILALAEEDFGVRVCSMPTNLARRKSKPKKEILTPEEVTKLIAFAKTDKERGIFVTFPFLTGVRVSEQLALLSLRMKQLGPSLAPAFVKNGTTKKIMKELEPINPRFFPDAINIVPSVDEDTAGRFISVDDDYLSREFAAEMYNLCGSVLHASNKPLVREVVSDRYAKAKRFDLEVRRLLETFEIDVNGEDFMVPGHLELEIDGTPKLFSASFGN